MLEGELRPFSSSIQWKVPPSVPHVLSVRLAKTAVAVAASAMLVAPSVASAAYPKQNTLPVWPDNPNDASIAIGVTPYDEIAPKLNALQAASNRVSARVAGRSSGGRDIYVVTVSGAVTVTT